MTASERYETKYPFISSFCLSATKLSQWPAICYYVFGKILVLVNLLIISQNVIQLKIGYVKKRLVKLPNFPLDDFSPNFHV